MTASLPSRLLVSIALAVLAIPLLAGLASADDAGESAPMPVPEAEVVEPERTVDDAVGDFLSSAGTALAKVGAGAVDILILRTMGTAATALGFGYFVVSTPMWAPSDGFTETWDIFVVAPVEYTFERPLGQF